MISLRGSMACKGIPFVSNNTNRCVVSSSDGYGFSSRFNSSSAAFVHFSRRTQFIGVTGNLKSMCHKEEDKAKAVSSLTAVLGEGKEVVWEEGELKEGDTVDLSNLLFTEERDYLIKCNGSQQVKAEQLEKKVVVIYFDSLLSIDYPCLCSLTLVYNDLQPKYPFEVVFVENNGFDVSTTPYETHAGKLFINEFLTMPWIAIPLSDVTSRKCLKQRFRLPEEPLIGSTFVIDPRGTIVQWEPYNFFHKYGATGYPFDKARIDFLKSEDEKAVRKPTLNALLANCERDYLISNKGDKVPIDTLEDKVVALFFYTECKLYREFTAELKVAYEELIQKDEKFEVVLIYLYDITSEEEFSNTFKTMPWLALPFKDSNYKKLERLFFYSWNFEMLEYGLVIIGPHMKFIHPFGLDIIQCFKSPAYPFTCERVAELLAEEAKELKLEMVWETFGGKHGSEVQLSLFAHKRVIILYDWYWYRIETSVEFIEELREKYETLMNTDKEFEVIYVTGNSAGNENVKNLPWVTVPDYKDESKFFELRRFYDRQSPSLLAFDEDGRIVRKTMGLFG